MNLNTMEFRAHDPEDYLTMLAGVDYDSRAGCGRWDTFIREVMCGDEELTDFLQRALGYALTGDTSMSVPAVIPVERTGDTSINTMNAPGDPIRVFLTTDQGMTFGVQNNYEQKPVLSDAREVKLIAETK